MSAVVANYLFAMDERQRALRGGMRREDAVGVPENSNAKRCLFGGPDPVELKRKYDEAHREEMKQKEKRWGFNFETETPTENSRYQWERVGNSVEVPASYAMPHLGGSQPQLNEDSIENSTSSEEESPPAQESSTATKQSLITDFMRQKRHANTGKGSSSKRQCTPPSPPPGAVSLAKEETSGP